MTGAAPIFDRILDRRAAAVYPDKTAVIHGSARTD